MNKAIFFSLVFLAAFSNAGEDPLHSSKGFKIFKRKNKGRLVLLEMYNYSKFHTFKLLKSFVVISKQCYHTS